MVKSNSKKKGLDSINSKISLVMKSGKADLGYKKTIKSLRKGKGKPHQPPHAQSTPRAAGSGKTIETQF